MIIIRINAVRPPFAANSSFILLGRTTRHRTRIYDANSFVALRASHDEYGFSSETFFSPSHTTRRCIIRCVIKTLPDTEFIHTQSGSTYTTLSLPVRNALVQGDDIYQRGPSVPLGSATRYARCAAGVFYGSPVRPFDGRTSVRPVFDDGVFML